MSPGTTHSVLVLHGPNLNLLGEREPDVYGSLTLEHIDGLIRARARVLGLEVRCAHSNVEGELIDRIQDARTWAHAIVINPGGYAHTSVAIRDAIAAVRLPTVVVHVSNPAAREAFRHTELVAGAATGMVAGFGVQSYLLALEAVRAILET
ncbi:MAG TPA: type II 3-dehydroquinate dehydratase [Actinomycetota bacterium]|nr:type II 3-dehydroquinate dehydratase [Actinomycetota bacterium]